MALSGNFLCLINKFLFIELSERKGIIPYLISYEISIDIAGGGESNVLNKSRAVK